MDEILAKLDAVIKELESRSVVLRLKGYGGDLINLLQDLTEGTTQLRKARRCLGRACAFLQKGYGKLVEPEEE
ncbi:MAG: hypothetical protein KAX80_07705 [Planctomycetes bacterium]|nr:hypothetical protein [Planctomycetota bacterium]